MQKIEFTASMITGGVLRDQKAPVDLALKYITISENRTVVRPNPLTPRIHLKVNADQAVLTATDSAKSGIWFSCNTMQIKLAL